MLILNEKNIKESKPVVYLMVGIPGSGKSTWCKTNHPELEVVSRDIIRTELGYSSSVDDKKKLNSSDENRVSIIEQTRIDELIKKCKTGSIKGFIIDDTNTGRFRKQLINHLHDEGCYVIGVNINTPLEVCIKRREGQIPEQVMRKLYKNKVDLKPYEVDEIINVGNVGDDTKNINNKDILYVGIELKEESKDRLIRIFDLLNPWDNNDEWKVICHHSTIAYGKSVNSILDWVYNNEGIEVELTAYKFGFNDKACAVEVRPNIEMPYINNIKHITLAVNKTNNGKPVDSNTITDWSKLNSIKLSGNVKVYYKS